MTTIKMQKTLALRNPHFDTVKLFEALREAKKEKFTRSGFRQKKSFAPSILAFGPGRCPRYWQLAFRGAWFDDVYTSSGATAMENGTDRHGRIEAIYELIDVDGIELEVEKEVKNEYPPVRGYADVVVNVDGELCVVDVKTINASGYSYCENSMSEKSSHLIQVLIYMKILKARNGLIHYENKDSGQEMLMPFAATQKYVDYTNELFEWMKRVYDGYEGPDYKRGFEKTSYACKHCPVRKACWAGDDGEIEIETLKDPA